MSDQANMDLVPVASGPTELDVYAVMESQYSPKEGEARALGVMTGNEPLALVPIADRYPISRGSAATIVYVAGVLRLALLGYRLQFVDLLAELLEGDPHVRSICSTRIKAVAGRPWDIVQADTETDDIEGERRLAYVAITRARQRLYLSHSQTRMLHGQTRFNLKSRFFDELPEDALKWLTPKLPAPAAFGGAGRGWQGGNASGYSGGYGNQGNSGFASTRYPSGDAVRVEKEVPRRDASVNGLAVKQKVFHAKFGEGTVLTLEGTGDDARAQINFPRHGTKWLALSVAKLTPVP